MMVCKCIKEIVFLLNGTKFINGNYYTYEFYNGIYCIKNSMEIPGVSEGFNQVMNESEFNIYFIDMSKAKSNVEKIEVKGPSKLSVTNTIDRSLDDLLKQGLGFLEAKENLRLRTVKLRISLERDMKTCELLKDMDPDILLYTPDYWKSVESSRVKYHLYYISHCFKRIDDINWCLTHRLKFYEYSASKLFNLIKLKDKLSLENAEPIELYTI